MLRNIILILLLIPLSPGKLLSQIGKRGKIEIRIIESLKEHNVSQSRKTLKELKTLGSGTIEENNNILFFEALIAQSNNESVEAILTYQKLLKQIPSGDVGTKSKVLHNLSAIYMDLYQTEAATQYILKSKREIWKTKDYLSRGKIAMQLADLYLMQHQYEKGVLACKDAEESFKLAKTEDYELAATLKKLYSQSKLGIALDDALLSQILKRITVLESGEAGRVTVTTAKINLADVLISNSFELNRAKEILDVFTPICDELNLGVMKAVAFKAYSNYYAKIRDFETSLKYMSDFSRLQDSIAIEGNRLKLNGLRVLHEIEQQRDNIRILNDEKKYQKLWLVFLVSLIVSLFTIALLVYRGIKRRLSKTQDELFSKNLAIENGKLQQRNLEVENELKNRELLSNVLLINQKNELIDRVDSIIKPVLDNEKLESFELKEIVQSIKSDLQSTNYIENNWENFIYHFEQVHPDFFIILQEKYTNLTANDLRHCAYIKMNLSRKEISLMLNVNIDAVKMARNRIKKKMNLQDDESLQSIVSRI